MRGTGLLDHGPRHPEANLANFPIEPAEGEHTTHLSTLDAAGNAVALTYTLEQGYGSKAVVEGAGFLLNNEMGDFNLVPGITTTRGLIGTEPNRIAPRKRMLSSMTPTIVLKDGRVRLVTGSPGGRTIPNTVLWVVLNVLEFERSPGGRRRTPNPSPVVPRHAPPGRQGLGPRDGEGTPEPGPSGRHGRNPGGLEHDRGGPENP